MQQFLRQLGPIVPGDAQRIALGLKESLGVQEVSIRGIAPTTHFAQVLVEADYRMKLIGIGLETPPVKIESYVSRPIRLRSRGTPWSVGTSCRTTSA
jgi:hypothetical protein